MVGIAAREGFNQSYTLGFYRKGYGGLIVEIDPIKFATLSFLYGNFENVWHMEVKLIPNNITSILVTAEIGKY